MRALFVLGICGNPQIKNSSLKLQTVNAANQSRFYSQKYSRLSAVHLRVSCRQINKSREKVSGKFWQDLCTNQEDTSVYKTILQLSHEYDNLH